MQCVYNVSQCFHLERVKRKRQRAGDDEDNRPGLLDFSYATAFISSSMKMLVKGWTIKIPDFTVGIIDLRYVTTEGDRGVFM